MFDKQYLLDAITIAISGIVGTLIYAFFWLPKHIQEMRLFAKGFVLGVIGGVVPVVFARYILRYLGVSDPTSDDLIACGFVVGAFAPTIYNLLGNFSRARANKDIISVANELRGGGDNKSNGGDNAN